MATADIGPGETLLEVPERLLITPAAALEAPAPLGPALEDCLEEMKDEDVLAVFLMHELALGPASFFWLYLAILPSDAGELSCIEWTEEEVAECQDPWLVVEVQRRRQEIEAGYQRVVQGVLKTRHPEVFGAAFSLAAFTYAMLVVQVRVGLGRNEGGRRIMVVAHYENENPSSCPEPHPIIHVHIQSRAFGRRLPFPSLVPLADLLNHGNVRIMYGLDSIEHNHHDQQHHQQQHVQSRRQEERVFRLFPNGGSGVRRGEEVLNSYGRRGNRHFLLHYAFALPDNEWESVEIAVPPLPAGSRSGSLVAVDEQHAESILRATMQTLTAAVFEWDLLWYVRTLTLTEDKGLTAKLYLQQPIDLTRPLSAAHERAALRRLGTLLEHALAAFPTSLEEDEAMLQQGVMCARRRAAITYRLTRKRILRKHQWAVGVLLRLVVEGRGADRVQREWDELFVGEDESLRKYMDGVGAFADERKAVGV